MLFVQHRMHLRHMYWRRRWPEHRVLCIGACPVTGPLYACVLRHFLHRGVAQARCALGSESNLHIPERRPNESCPLFSSFQAFTNMRTWCEPCSCCEDHPFIVVCSLSTSTKSQRKVIMGGVTHTMLKYAGQAQASQVGVRASILICIVPGMSSAHAASMVHCGSC